MKHKGYSDKSFVTLEQQVCMVCGKTYDTGSLLLDTRLRDTFEHYTVTGMGLCPEDQKKNDEGYLAIVEIDPAKSGNPLPNGNLDPKQVWRTGRLLHMRRTVAAEVFSVPIPEKCPLIFMDPDAVEKIISMMPEEDRPKEEDHGNNT